MNQIYYIEWTLTVVTLEARFVVFFPIDADIGTRNVLATGSTFLTELFFIAIATDGLVVICLQEGLLQQGLLALANNYNLDM